MGPTDEELMSAYVAGSPARSRASSRGFAPRVHGFFLRCSGMRRVADDLLQVTFMKVHRARAQYRPELKLMPWLFAWLRGCAWNELRPGCAFTNLYGCWL